jgi:hypothetical protein
VKKNGIMIEMKRVILSASIFKLLQAKSLQKANRNILKSSINELNFHLVKRNTTFKHCKIVIIIKIRQKSALSETRVR